MTAIAQSHGAHVATLAERVDAALQAAGADRLVILAGEPVFRPRDDQAYPFAPEPYFRQCVPIAEPAGSVLIFEPGRRPRVLLPAATDFWHAPLDTQPAFWQDSVTVSFLTAAEVDRELRTSTAASAVIGAPTVPFARHAARDQAVLNQLDYYRAFKTPYEVACIDAATRAAVQGHLAVSRRFAAAPVSEFELHGEYCQSVQLTEAELPYPNIIALNEHASVLHYQHRDRAVPPQSRSLLIDAGATCYGYASDITRTWPADGFFSGLVQALDSAQQVLCAKAVAGTEFTMLNEMAHELVADILAGAGLVRCSAADAYERGVTRAFLPHGLGHLLGLQVHDAGGKLADTAGTVHDAPAAHPFLRLTRRLEAGFVLTIEPGLYFIQSLLDELHRAQPDVLNLPLIAEVKGCGGIRIEDNILVGAASSTNLTRSVFTTG